MATEQPQGPEDVQSELTAPQTPEVSPAAPHEQVPGATVPDENALSWWTPPAPRDPTAGSMPRRQPAATLPTPALLGRAVGVTGAAGGR